MNKQVRVTAGSRLHFGLLDTAAPYGGVGVMIQSPHTEIIATEADRFCPSNVASERVEAIGRRFAGFAGMSQLPPCKIEILSRPDPHTGLGSGTQLAMSVAGALCALFQVECSDHEMAFRIADRGRRSAVGIHGHLGGGLVYEDSICENSNLNDSASQAKLNPIRHRVGLPTDWCVALFSARRRLDVVSGELEQSQFAKLPPASAVQRQKLREIAEHRLIPAVHDGDFFQFADAVQRYNHTSGLLFESVQNGAYNGPEICLLVRTLLEHGAYGVGQSSWGPTVFSWFRSGCEAKAFVAKNIDTESVDVQITYAENEGRLISII
ncbi:hypothetical protein CA13_44720 [Planctomycetes bacterium CA13]|uniref:Uncharacterized protein n=1 Tax=Novipirellula herctigrandis TaxID=2527986 RepID=A0A5C5Z6G5_9BACT|nr:hypothetical protein CA13_44720 [Planctomycetes bacterium CA13]